jgi:NAD(P)-dependent dehydrogenase (short-subunit alcohol dehydrogenase family)
MSDVKTIVITGVTKGLGLAMANKFLDMRHRVAGCGRGKLPEIITPSPEVFDFKNIDISVGEQVNQWATEIIRKWQAPDILINNAAIMNRTAPLWTLSEEEISQIIDINIKGTINTIRAFTPAMIERGSGIIVNFSSGWGRSTSPDVAPYCTTKWAIEGMSRALAQELPAGLATIALNPGIIDTEMLRTAWGSGASSFPVPNDWAEKAVPFILNLKGSQNGQSLNIS